MTREEAINVLKTDSCYECSWGCDSPVSCHCGGCDLAEATRIAIESLQKDGLVAKKGHWIRGIKPPTDKSNLFVFECSVCGWKIMAFYPPGKYCSQCGAKMEVSE